MMVVTPSRWMRLTSMQALSPLSAMWPETLTQQEMARLAALGNEITWGDPDLDAGACKVARVFIRGVPLDWKLRMQCVNPLAKEGMPGRCNIRGTTLEDPEIYNQSPDGGLIPGAHSASASRESAATARRRPVVVTTHSLVDVGARSCAPDI